MQEWKTWSPPTLYERLAHGRDILSNYMHPAIVQQFKPSASHLQRKNKKTAMFLSRNPNIRWDNNFRTDLDYILMLDNDGMDK